MFGKKTKEKRKKKEPCNACKSRITKATEESEAYKEKFLRASADLENYKKRQQKEMDMYKKTSLQSIVLDFLPVIDDINMAIMSVSKDVANGLELSKINLLKKLKKYGIKPIEVENEFDPNFHEAVMIMKKEGCKKDTILTVIEEGYLLNDFLLKPAKVVVSE